MPRDRLPSGQEFVMVLDIKQKEILRLQPRTTADLLSKNGNVFVQKSQFGGGSPILRGFEANRILLIVDGIRMNNYNLFYLFQLMLISYVDFDQ